MFEQIHIVKKSQTIIFNFCILFAISSQDFEVEQFGIWRWKANEKTNLLIVSKLKWDAYSLKKCNLCLNNPNHEEKLCVRIVQYVHSKPHTLLLTSGGLALKARILVLTLKLLKSRRMRPREVRLQKGPRG